MMKSASASLYLPPPPPSPGGEWWRRTRTDRVRVIAGCGEDPRVA